MTTTYESLNPQEKALFKKIDGIYILYPSVTRVMFCKILGIILNKYKLMGRK